MQPSEKFPGFFPGGSPYFYAKHPAAPAFSGKTKSAEDKGSRAGFGAGHAYLFRSFNERKTIEFPYAKGAQPRAEMNNTP